MLPMHLLRQLSSLQSYRQNEIFFVVTTAIAITARIAGICPSNDGADAQEDDDDDNTYRLF